MSRATEETAPLDLDVQDATSGGWDALVSQILSSAGDLTPADPDLEIPTACPIGGSCAGFCGCVFNCACDQSCNC